jgi:phosphomethylpyrimidine synthase
MKVRSDSGLKLLSMKISQSITAQFGGTAAAGATAEEAAEGMLQKSKEFAAAGNRVYSRWRTDSNC